MKNNMEQFPGKRMPYKESDEYVAQLIQNCADRAVREARKSPFQKVKHIAWKVGAAAAILVVGVLMFFSISNDSEYDIYMQSEPLADVLASMSDEQVMDLYCYELDEIPEYYE